MGKKFETFNNGCFSSRCYLKNNPSVIQDIFGKIQHKITLYKTSVTRAVSDSQTNVYFQQTVQRYLDWQNLVSKLGIILVPHHQPPESPKSYQSGLLVLMMLQSSCPKSNQWLTFSILD